MNITSSAFNNNESIPEKYTCDGDGINPPLTFDNVPDKVKSFVLIMNDPDIPDFVKQKMNIEVFDHWLIFNMPAETKELLENSIPPGLQGNNSRGEAQYTGPCPPDKEHRYFFKLYALDTMLDLPEGSDKVQIETAMQGHIIEETQLIGLYVIK